MAALYLDVDDGSKLAEVLVELGDVVELTWDLAHLQLSVHIVIPLGKAALDLVIKVGPKTKGRKGLNVKMARPVIHWLLFSCGGSDYLLLHPGFFTGWSVSCVGRHASLPVVLIRVKTGGVARSAARRRGGLCLDHYVGSWG